MRISDWSSDVCSSDLAGAGRSGPAIQSKEHCKLQAFGDAGGLGLQGMCRVGRHQFVGGLLPEVEPAFEQFGRDPVLVLHMRRDGLTLVRSEEHTSELQSLMRISYAVFCLKKKKNKIEIT